MTKTEDNPMHPKTREPLRLRQAPRCLARTRRGRPCQSPAVAGKTRCRMHGGAAGSGAPKGKRNGKYRHGGFTTNAFGCHASDRILRETCVLMTEIRHSSACDREPARPEIRCKHASKAQACQKPDAVSE